MSLLERTWFKCRTCGTECSKAVLASYTEPGSATTETWGECTTCATQCPECLEPVDIRNLRFGHSGHRICTLIWCKDLNDWVDSCDLCDLCYSCDHCDICDSCDGFACTCYRGDE